MSSCFHLVILLVLEFTLQVHFGIFFVVFVRCKFFTGGRVCEVRADLGSLVPLKFLFGFIGFSFSLVDSFLPIETV